MPLATLPNQRPQPVEPDLQPKAPSRKVAALGGLATVLLIGGGVWAGYELWQKSAADQQQKLNQAAIQVVPVRKGAIQQITRVEGTTAAKTFVNVIAPRLSMPESERPMVILKLAPSGTVVKKGELIVEIDPQNLRDHIDDTRDGYNNYQNLTKKKQVELELAKESMLQKLRVARGTLEKAHLDVKTIPVRSAIVAQTMRLAVEEAEALVKQTEADLPLLERSQAADLRFTQLREELERRHLGRHTADLAKLAIPSPVGGMVVLSTVNRRGGEQMTVSEGDSVSPGSLIMQVVDRGSLVVNARVNQAGIEKFKIGQKASVGFDAYPNARFAGRVSAIGALATMPSRRDQYYIRTIPIQIQLEELDERVLPDLTAYAEIETDSVKDTLIAPASAVVHEKDKTFVYVRNRGQFEKREVTVGMASNTEVAILEGLDEGEQVRVN